MNLTDAYLIGLVSGGLFMGACWFLAIIRPRAPWYPSLSAPTPPWQGTAADSPPSDAWADAARRLANS